MTFIKKALISGAAVAALLAVAPLMASAQVASAQCGYPYNTFYNNPNCGMGSLQVYVQVLNPVGNVVYGPANFTVTVSGNNPSPASFAGSVNGTLVSLGAGPYAVVLANNQYNTTPSYSQGCTGTVTNGSTATCVVTVSNTSPYNQYPTPYSGPYYPQQLSCAPAYQTVSAGQAATFTAIGGTTAVGSGYNWSTASRTFLNIGSILSTTFQSTGDQSVIVTNGTQTATCTVNVVGGGPIIYPGPTPTVISTYIPTLPNTGFAPAGAAGAALAVLLCVGSGIILLPYARKALAIVSR